MPIMLYQSQLTFRTFTCLIYMQQAIIKRHVSHAKYLLRLLLTTCSCSRMSTQSIRINKKVFKRQHSKEPSHNWATANSPQFTGQISPTVRRALINIKTSRLTQLSKTSLSARRCRVRFPARSNRTQCRQQLDTAAIFLRSCVTRGLRSEDGPHHSFQGSV